MSNHKYLKLQTYTKLSLTTEALEHAYDQYHKNTIVHYLGQYHKKITYRRNNISEYKEIRLYRCLLGLLHGLINKNVLEMHCVTQHYITFMMTQHVHNTHL